MNEADMLMAMKELWLMISNIFRVGEIIEINHLDQTAKVRIGEGSEPWMSLVNAHAAPGLKSWLPREVGEQVVTICPNGDPGRGYILGSLFSQDNPPPVNDPVSDAKKPSIQIDDFELSFDRDSKKLSAKNVKSLAITNGNNDLVKLVVKLFEQVAKSQAADPMAGMLAFKMAHEFEDTLKSLEAFTKEASNAG